MKFNEMTYTRPDIGALLARCKEPVSYTHLTLPTT